MNLVKEIDVSIVLPIRNAAKMLDAALAAIYAQMDIRFELIVMDGNSTDETAVIVQKWLRSHDTYVRRADNGIYDAINQGIAQAKGRWIYIQGADDCLSHDKVLSQVIASAVETSRLLLGDVEYKMATSHWVKRRHVSSFGWGLLLRNTLHQQSVLYHHSLFERNLFDVGFKILSDYAFHLKLFFSNHVNTTAVVKLDTVIANCGADGISKKFNKNLYQEEWRVRKANLPLFFLLLTFPIAPIKYLLKAK